MKERPILFSTPMVREILSGTKTQTRRLVRLKPWHQIEERDDITPWPWMYDAYRDADCWLPCPHGHPGDRLLVREAWRASLAFELTPPRDIPAGTPLLYTADGSGALPPENAGKYRPPMFMPRWASRITLEVTGVRVERLQDISEADAIAEGLTCRNGLYATSGEVWQIDPRKAYRDLWERLNGSGSWNANPWVWVVEFRRLP